MIESMDGSEEDYLIMQLQMFSLRERRLMKHIQRYQGLEIKNHGLAVKAVSKTKKVEDLSDAEGMAIGNGMYKKVTETSVTHTEAVMNSIMTLETELTKVQRAKTKAIEALSKIRDAKKESIGNDVVDDWIAAVLEESDG